MTDEMIAPIVRLPKRSIWLYRHGITRVTGNTFMMAFIAAKSYIWKDILKYDYDPQIHSDIGQGLHNWIKKYAHYFTKETTQNITEDNTITAITKSSNNTYTWEVDQLIISRAILSSGLCSLSADNSLWTKVSLEDQAQK